MVNSALPASTVVPRELCSARKLNAARQGCKFEEESIRYRSRGGSILFKHTKTQPTLVAWHPARARTVFFFRFAESGRHRQRDSKKQLAPPCSPGL
jgi:hypothetical protein